MTECGLREVKEETGITIPEESLKDAKPYYIFESASGRFDENNPQHIKSGHLIVFFKVELDKNANLYKPIVQKSEVSSLAWLSKS